MQTRLVIAAVAAALALAACGGDSKQPEPAPQQDAPSTAAPTPLPVAPVKPAGPSTKAAGFAECRELRLELQTAFVVWNGNDRSLRVELYPFALSDEERQRVIEEGSMQSLRKEKGSPDPNVWGSSAPYAEVILRFQEDAGVLDVKALQDARMGFTDFDASPNVSSSQIYVRPETDYVKDLSVSGAAKGDAVHLVFTTPEGRDEQGKLEVTVDATIALSR